MRQFSLSLLLAPTGAFLLSAPFAMADVELPRPVPAAKLAQQVGLTEIAVEYECPAAKGRKIWGGVVPYGEVWSLGPTQATKIKFTKDVTVGDRPVAAGTYWLLATPTKTTWTVMINKSPDVVASARDYRPDLDVVRLQVSPKATPRRERLVFGFSEITDERASLDLEWDTLRVSIPIQVNTNQQILASINGLDGTWRSYANAARFMLEKRKDYDAGLRYVDQALALKDDWYTMWVKGALFAAKGNYAAASEWARRARELADRVGDGAPLASDLNKALADWTRRSGGHVAKEAEPLTKVSAGKDVGPTTPPTAEPATPPAFKPSDDRQTSPTVPRADEPPALRRARLRRP